MSYHPITSSTNPRIKSLMRLHNASERKKRRLCIIEGQRAVSTVLSKTSLESLYCTETMLSYAQALAPQQKIYLVSEALMKKISTASSPSGLLAVVHIPQEPSQDELTPGLVLADITDPGNMGTLLRTAVALNIRSAVIIDGCDPWSPKVMQATAGTIVHLNIFQWSFERLIKEKKHLLLYALVVHGGTAPADIDSDRALLIIGNEARGVPQAWLASCDAQITLPMPGATESLNAAVAGSIAAYLTFMRTL